MRVPPPVAAVPIAAVLCAVVATPAMAQPAADIGWPHYGNDPGGARYSTAAQIDRTNVGQFRPAGTYRTGALGHSAPLDRKAAFEATPILVDGKLLLSTPYNHVIALDPRTGAKLWEYDAALDLSHGYSEVTSRGVAAWGDPASAPGRPCRTRIFMGTLDARLAALDGDTGGPCADFGDRGQVDLTRGVDLRDLGNDQMTPAPAVVGDVVVVGSSIGDNRAVDVERGIVRAFDARSGALRWSWDPIPWAARTTPRTGAGNAWSTLSVDPERGLVSCRPAAPVPTTGAARARATTGGRTPSSPCAPPPASSCGDSRSSTTISGTTTSRPSPRSSPGATAPPRSRSPRRWAASSSSTASPASR